MSGKAQQELPQVRRFENEAGEAYVNVLRTADWLLRDTEKLLAAERLTPPQYNVLRILRGAMRQAGRGGGRGSGSKPGGEGLPCSEIGARMITRDPDMTRLLDRLEKRKLIARTRDAQDRRVVNVRVSAEGLRILSKLDRPVAALHERQLRVLGRAETRKFIALLEKLRDA